MLKTMTRSLSPLLIAAIAVGGSLLAEEEKEVDLKKVSETFGYFIGSTLLKSEQLLPLDTDLVIQGIRNGVEGKEPPMSEEEYQEAIMTLQKKSHDDVANKNLQDAEQFLKENAEKDGITVLESGKLQYQVVEEGSGNEIKEESTPSIHYKGSFLDGKEFGNSEETGPLIISVTETVPGFQKGLLGMKEGEKRKLFIHPDLGYGTSGQLPPNSLLIFDIEVLKADTAEENEDSPEES